KYPLRGAFPGAQPRRWDPDRRAGPIRLPHQAVQMRIDTPPLHGRQVCYWGRRAWIQTLPSGSDDAARHDSEDIMQNTPFWLAGLLVLPVAAQAKTEISWWHAMSGANAEVVSKIAGDFNASQEEYEVKPVFKGTYPE